MATPEPAAQAAPALRRYGPVLVLLAIPALLPVGRSAELPVLVAALGGIAWLWRVPALRTEPGVRLASWLFLGYWLPELAAAPDALDRARAWQEVAADLRFLPLLWFGVAALRAPGTLAFAWRGLAVIAAAFAADALVQAATGFSLGGGDAADRLSGVFGADNLKLGPVLAVLAAPLLLVALQRAGWAGGLAAFALLLPVVLLAGARAGWLGLAVAVFAVAWHRLGLRRAALAAVAGLLLGVLAGAIAYPVSERFAERVDRSAALLAGDAAGLEHALAGRLAIWRAALEIGAAHPVNGVGPRSFRVAYPQVAAADDRWVREGGTALHAHHWLLEVFAETGLIGVACWLGALWLALRAWLAAARNVRVAAAPAAIALVVMLFPLNTHYAVYSSTWGVLLFALLAFHVGALAHARQDTRP